MPGGLLGKKLGMTQIYDEAGLCVPVTVLRLGPCTITQKKSPERDGYAAIQIGYDEVAEKRLSKAERGHLQANKLKSFRHLREFRPSDEAPFNVGQELAASLVQVGDSVDIVSETSKGKGFQGVMKRHNFSGGPGAHGSHFHRVPGSIGQCTSPGEVHKGRKMPGQMGNKRITVKNLKVVAVNADDNHVLVRGAVPGPNGGLVFVRLTDNIFLERVKQAVPAEEAPAEEVKAETPEAEEKPVEAAEAKQAPDAAETPAEPKKEGAEAPAGQVPKEVKEEK